MNSVFVPEEEIRRQLETAEIYGNRYPGGKYRVECFGCQQNEADAERIAGIAEAMGYSEAGVYKLHGKALRKIHVPE